MPGSKSALYNEVDRKLDVKNCTPLVSVRFYPTCNVSQICFVILVQHRYSKYAALYLRMHNEDRHIFLSAQTVDGRTPGITTSGTNYGQVFSVLACLAFVSSHKEVSTKLVLYYLAIFEKRHTQTGCREIAMQRP